MGRGKTGKKGGRRQEETKRERKQLIKVKKVTGGRGRGRRKQDRKNKETRLGREQEFRKVKARKEASLGK